MLVMCKLFDCTLDELMQEDIAQLRKDEGRKYTVNDLINEITDIIRRTSNMISGMSKRSLFRLFVELFILFILISLIKIPFNNAYDLGWGVFMNFGEQVGGIFSSIWYVVVECIYFVVATLFAVYVYKIRFLDRYEEAVEGKSIPNEIEIESTSIEKEITTVKNIEIRKYDFGLFSLIAKLGLLSIKGFVLILFIPTIFAALGSVAAVVVNITWMLGGVYYFSMLLFGISFFIFCATLLYIGYNFILNIRSSWSGVFIILLSTLIGFGVSMGIGVIDINTLTISTEKHNSVVQKEYVETFKMNDSLIMLPYWPPVEYVEDSSLKDRVKVSVMYYDDFQKYVIQNEENKIYVYGTQTNVSMPKVYSLFFEDLKSRTIHVNYNYLFDGKVSVYTSKENIKKLEENTRKLYLED